MSSSPSTRRCSVTAPSRSARFAIRTSSFAFLSVARRLRSRALLQSLSAFCPLARTDSDSSRSDSSRLRYRPMVFSVIPHRLAAVRSPKAMASTRMRDARSRLNFARAIDHSSITPMSYTSRTVLHPHSGHGLDASTMYRCSSPSLTESRKGLAPSSSRTTRVGRSALQLVRVHVHRRIAFATLAA